MPVRLLQGALPRHRQKTALRFSRCLRPPTCSSPAGHSRPRDEDTGRKPPLEHQSTAELITARAELLRPSLSVEIAMLIRASLGHFLAARAFKITVAKVCAGIGPQLFKYTDSRGTTWQLRLFPVAAFCILDWAIESRTSDDKPIEPNAKIAVLAADPLASLGSGFVLINYSISRACLPS